MSRKVGFNKRKELLWEGYQLTSNQKLILTEIVLDEFKLPVHKRRTPRALVLEARLLSNYNNKYKKLMIEKREKWAEFG